MNDLQSGRGSRTSKLVKSTKKQSLLALAEEYCIPLAANDTATKIRSKIDARVAESRDFEAVDHVIAIDVGSINFSFAILNLEKETKVPMLIALELSHVAGLQDADSTEKEAKTLFIFLDCLFNRQYKHLMKESTRIVIEKQQRRRQNVWIPTIDKMIRVESMLYMFFVNRGCQSVQFDGSALGVYLQGLYPGAGKKRATNFWVADQSRQLEGIAVGSRSQHEADALAMGLLHIKWMRLGNV